MSNGVMTDDEIKALIKGLTQFILDLRAETAALKVILIQRGLVSEEELERLTEIARKEESAIFEALVKPSEGPPN